MRFIPTLLAAFFFSLPVAAMAQVSYSEPTPSHASGPDAFHGGNQQTILCESTNNRQQSCRVPFNWHSARLVQQLSNAQCVEGRSWGFARGSIWVNQGCRGRFAERGWQPGPGWNQDFVVSCGSPQFRYYFCQVDVGPRGKVVLQRQTSNARCIEGRTWGWNRAGIWVDQGCGGQFLVMRRW